MIGFGKIKIGCAQFSDNDGSLELLNYRKILNGEFLDLISKSSEYRV